MDTHLHKITFRENLSIPFGLLVTIPKKSTNLELSLPKKNKTKRSNKEKKNKSKKKNSIIN